MKEKKVSVGDYIVYNSSIYDGYYDNGRIQVITKIKDGYIYSEFMSSDGYSNVFAVNSEYFDDCDIVDNKELLKWDNGIPMMWEDEV